MGYFFFFTWGYGDGEMVVFIVVVVGVVDFECLKELEIRVDVVVETHRLSSQKALKTGLGFAA